MHKRPSTSWFISEVRDLPIEHALQILELEPNMSTFKSKKFKFLRFFNSLSFIGTNILEINVFVVLVRLS